MDSQPQFSNLVVNGNHFGHSKDEHNPSGYLIQEYEKWQTLFGAQPTLVQRFYDSQARVVANALINDLNRVRFSLPDRVVINLDQLSVVGLPASQREQVVGSIWRFKRGASLGIMLRHHLDHLEALTDGEETRNIATAAGLMRYAISRYMIVELLPAGRPVVYTTENGDEIPSSPVLDLHAPGSAITATTDAIVEENLETSQEHGELLVPYVPAAVRFYLPQWVAFDEHDQLLVGSVAEAEAQIASMKRFLRILHGAVALAPYMVADSTYQLKRYGMLGQFVNQGRALARYKVRQIILTIQKRASNQNMNRGLSIDLPYLNDQDLEMKVYPFQIIPAGRIMFIPGFVVRAAVQEQVKVAQDTRLSASTRKHLLISLSFLEAAFNSSEQSH